MTKQFVRVPLLAASPGTERCLVYHRYGEAGARPKAYLQAALHADEIPPLLVAHHLIRLLDEADRQGWIRGEIIVVPMANPVGVGQVVNARLLGRHELGGGGNFNRNWPDLASAVADVVKDRLTKDATANVALIRQAMISALQDLSRGTELASLRTTLALLACDADIVLDMHCDLEALLHIFSTPANWHEAQDLAAETGARAVLLAEDSGGSSFDEAFSGSWVRLAAMSDASGSIPQACFAATIEYRGTADVSDELAGPDAAALFRFLQRRSVIAGDPGPLTAQACDATMLDACDIVRAPAAGVLSYKQSLGARVAEGDVIAELVNPAAENPEAARTPIRSGTDGFILSRRPDHLVRPGDTVAKVVGTRSLPQRKGLLLED
jgi:uncharacterized protein